jgi:hypothetical protein
MSDIEKLTNDIVNMKLEITRLTSIVSVHSNQIDHVQNTTHALQLKLKSLKKFIYDKLRF